MRNPDRIVVGGRWYTRLSGKEYPVEDFLIIGGEVYERTAGDDMILVKSGTCGWALEELKAGRKVTRPSWSGKGQYVYRVTFTGDKGLMRPCYVIHHADGGEQPGWVPSIGDCEAEDWEEWGE